MKKSPSKTNLDAQIKKLCSIRRDLAKAICTAENYVFSTKALRKAPTYYFEAPLKNGVLIARIRQHRTYGTKISIYLNGRRRFTSPRNSKEVEKIWNDRNLRNKTFKHILNDEKVRLFETKPKNKYRVVAVARTARFRSLGLVENLNKPSPLSTLELSCLIDTYPDDQIALYL